MAKLEEGQALVCIVPDKDDMLISGATYWFVYDNLDGTIYVATLSVYHGKRIGWGAFPRCLFKVK